MRGVGALVGLVFAGTLAYLIGVRLSESAMAVVVGVVFGVAASIPTSIFLLLALRRAERRAYTDMIPPREERPTPPPPPQQPTVIVATPPAMPGLSHGLWQGMYLPPVYGEEEDGAPRRRFRVVGED